MKHSEILKRIRLENFDISQKKLADAMNIDLSVINSIESGRSKIKFELAQKLHEKFGYNIEKLLQGELEKENIDIFQPLKERLNLTDSEFNLLENILIKDKMLVITFLNAANGDDSAKERLKKLL